MLDSNWRRYWWAHALHFLQGGFTAALVADGWPVLATFMFLSYAFYQYIEWRVRGDTIVRDWKVYMVALWAGGAATYVSGWSPVDALRSLF